MSASRKDVTPTRLKSPSEHIATRHLQPPRSLDAYRNIEVDPTVPTPPPRPLGRDYSPLVRTRPERRCSCSGPTAGIPMPLAIGGTTASGMTDSALGGIGTTEANATASGQRYLAAGPTQATWTRGSIFRRDAPACLCIRCVVRWKNFVRPRARGQARQSSSQHLESGTKLSRSQANLADQREGHTARLWQP